MTYMTHKEFYKKATENGVEWVKKRFETIILNRVRRKLQSERADDDETTQEY